jgi:threonine synthase
MERLRTLFPARLAEHISAQLVTDDEIRETIRQDARTLGYVWDPHGATAARVHHGLPDDRLRDPWVLVETAHPAKFNEIVEPLVGDEIAVPPALERLLKLPRREEDLEPTIDAFRSRLTDAGATSPAP